MKRMLIIIVLLTTSIALALWKTGSFDDNLIVPGKRVGWVTGGSTEKELIEAFGKQNVIRDTIHVCDGYDGPGTVLFPHDELHKMLIVWEDQEGYRYPDFVILRGSRTAYKTREGISLGCTIRDIERLNEKAFTLYGFEWDFQGMVINWLGGKLSYLNSEESAKQGKAMTIAFTLSEVVNVPNEKLTTIIGDKELLSSDEIVQMANPTVNNLLVNLTRE